MQKQINSSTLAKKKLEKIIDKKLGNYPTKADIKKDFIESEERIDKKFTNRQLDNQSAFRNEMRHEFKTSKEDILTAMSKFTSMILTAIDPLVKDMEIRQQDREIASDQMLRVRKELDNHGKRIKKLEQS